MNHKYLSSLNTRTGQRDLPAPPASAVVLRRLAGAALLVLAASYFLSLP